MNGADLIKQERERQIYGEGWTKEHDDKHVNNELALAAACYAVPDVFSQGYWPPTWDLNWYKSTTRIRDLVKAGALIAAEIDRLRRIEIKEAKRILVPKIKIMVDNTFKKFGEDGDNIIILSACYYPERNTVEIEEPLVSIKFNRKDEFGSKLYFPVGRNWKLGNWSHEGPDSDKYNDLYDNYISPICKILDKCNIDWFAEEYYEENNDALNEFWCGCIGIMKDYKVVSFVIRDDGWPCSTSSINDGWNKIITEL